MARMDDLFSFRIGLIMCPMLVTRHCYQGVWRVRVARVLTTQSCVLICVSLCPCDYFERKEGGGMEEKKNEDRTKRRRWGGVADMLL